VLSNIGAFCGIDGRRALLQKPNRLRRDAVFDEKMQIIHRRQIHRRFGPYKYWDILINKQMNITITKDVVCFRVAFPSLNCPKRTADCYNASDGDRCYVDLPALKLWDTATWFEGGKWHVSRKRNQLEKDDCKYLTALGYVIHA
jgi:hypothetical protein